MTEISRADFYQMQREKFWKRMGKSASIFECNLGSCIMGNMGDAARYIDILGQGDGTVVCVEWYQRLRKKTDRAESLLYKLGDCLNLLARAAKHHNVSDDQVADLCAYMVERLMHMDHRKAE